MNLSYYQENDDSNSISDAKTPTFKTKTILYRDSIYEEESDENLMLVFNTKSGCGQKLSRCDRCLELDTTRYCVTRLTRWMDHAYQREITHTPSK